MFLQEFGTDIYRERACEDTGKANIHPPEREVSGGSSPAHARISDLQPLALGGEFLSVKACGALFWQPQGTDTQVLRKSVLLLVDFLRGLSGVLKCGTPFLKGT